jgi:hypothetical protein
MNEMFHPEYANYPYGPPRLRRNLPVPDTLTLDTAWQLPQKGTDFLQ